jgi:ribonuclease Y
VNGAFEALIVVGLFLLIGVVGLATLVMARRGRHGTGAYQPGTAHAAARPGVTRSAGSALAGDQINPGDRNASAAGDQTSSETEVRELRAKAEKLLASAQAARAEAEEESRARRTELREQRADVERREQRLSDREER